MLPGTSLFLLLAILCLPGLSGPRRRIDEWLDKRLCKEYQATGDNAYAEVLLSRYRPLLRSMSVDHVQVASMPYHHIDDVDAEVSDALVRAMDHYDGRNGASFPTFLRAVASHAASNYLRHERRHSIRHDRSLDSLPVDIEPDEFSLDLILPGEAVVPGPTVTCYHCPVLVEFSGSLNAKDRTTLDLVAGGGTEADIAEALGCSHCAAHARRSRLFHRLRDACEKACSGM